MSLVWFVRLKVCVTAILALPAILVGQADTSDVAVLTFNWPPGLEAHVTHDRLQVRDLDGKVDTSATHITYRMSVEDHPAGQLVRCDSFSTSGFALSLPGPDPADVVATSELNAFVMGSFMPSLVITESGELIGLAEADRFAELVHTLLQPVVDSLPPEASGVRQLVDRFLSLEFFTAKAAEEWNALVGTWFDLEFERGFIYEVEADEAIPMFPDVTVPYLYQFSFTERVPCSESASEIECVVVEMVSFPDPDAVTEFLDRLAQDIAGPTPVYRHLDLENSVILVTKQDGLIPYHLEIRQLFTVETGVSDQRVSKLSQRRIRTFTYSY